jgi:hypothetical protein
MFTINCVILYMMNKVTHNIGGVMGLQNCMDVLKSEPGPCTGTYQISYDDVNEVTVKRGEEVIYIKVEADPWPATSTGIKTEPAVSYVCVCVEVYADWTDNVQTVCRTRCYLKNLMLFWTFSIITVTFPFQLKLYI